MEAGAASLVEKDDPRYESRALCGLMAAKEFLVMISVVLMVFDACYIYYIIVRATGDESLPFPWNPNGLHEASLGPALNWLECWIFGVDLISVAILAVSGEPADCMPIW